MKNRTPTCSSPQINMHTPHTLQFTHTDTLSLSLLRIGLAEKITVTDLCMLAKEAETASQETTASKCQQVALDPDCHLAGGHSLEAS